MQARANERGECDQSSQPDISNLVAHPCTCHAARTCNCPDGECADADRDDDYGDKDIFHNGDESRNENGSEGGIISQHF